MSKKIGSALKCVNIFFLYILIFGVFSCDPCKQLAESICQCKPYEERQECLREIASLREHDYYKIARDPKICEEKLEKCTCEQLNDGNDRECGMYRSDPEDEV